MTTMENTGFRCDTGEGKAPSPVVVLWVEFASTSRWYRYQGRSGKEYLFEKDGNRHVLRVPIDQWRAAKHNIAHDLLNQNLVSPIFFDVEIPEPAEARPVVTVQPPPPQTRDLGQALAQRRGPGRPRKYPLPNVSDSTATGA